MRFLYDYPTNKKTRKALHQNSLCTLQKLKKFCTDQAEILAWWLYYNNPHNNNCLIGLVVLSTTATLEDLGSSGR